MEKFFFMRPLLDRLGDGRFFARMVALTLRTLAALIVLFSLTNFFEVGKLIFKLPTNGILGGVIFEILYVLAVYAVAHVLLIRAGDISRLPAGGASALPIAPVLIRALGEAYASFVVFVAIGSGVFVWFTALKIDKVLNPFIRSLFVTPRSDSSFMGGIEFMLSGALTGIGAVVLAYILAEAFEQLNRGARPTGVSRQGTSEIPPSRFGT